MYDDVVAVNRTNFIVDRYFLVFAMSRQPVWGVVTTEERQVGLPRRHPSRILEMDGEITSG